MDDSNITPEHDAEIVRHILRGDSDAETALWNRFHRVTVFMLRARTRRADVAEDLWHDTYINVLKKIRSGSLKEPTKLAGYVHKTAEYVCRAWLRGEVGHKTDTDPEIDERFPSNFESPPCCIQREQVERALRRLISEMRVARDREILIRFLEGQTKEQICRDLRLSVAHYDRVISRARKRLAELLIEQGVDRDDLRPWLDGE